MTSFKNVPLLGIMDGFVRGCVCWLGCPKKNVGGEENCGPWRGISMHMKTRSRHIGLHDDDAKRKLEQYPLSHDVNIHDEPECMLQL